MRTIDSHFHWFPRPHLERMCGRAGYPRAEREDDGYVYIYNSGRSSMRLPAVWFDLEAGLATAEVGGHEAAVVCTTGVLAGLIDQLPASEAFEIALEYNEALAAAQQRNIDRFYGTAFIPLLDTGEAVSMAEFAVKELGLKAVNLPPLSGSDFIDAGRLEPFYSRIEELGVPLIIHPTDLLYGETMTEYGGAMQLTIGRLLDSSMTVLRLIFSGIMERHPELTVIHTHAGGLLPYQAGRIDKNARVPGLSLSPSAYLKRIYVDTVAPQALTVRTAVGFYGEDHVLYGTDYPCWSPSKALEILAEADLAANVQEAIRGGNAEKVLKLA